MPENLSDSLVKNLNLSGYTPVAVTPPPPTTGVSENLQPNRSMFTRCLLPAIWQPSPDALREMYVGGKIPQTRLFNPSQASGGGTSTSSTTIIAGGGTPSGGGGGGRSLPSSQVVLKTPTLPPGNTFTSSVTMAPSFQLLLVTADAACRVEIYGTVAAQLQDIARAVDVPPPAGTMQNLISDVALDTVPFQWSYQNRIGANADNPQTSAIYVTVTNLSATTSFAFTVTLRFVPLEE